MSLAEPTSAQRWRCSACGNLTRFDVTRSCRVVDFVHLDLAGQARVEERRMLRDVIERVRCRWCDRDDTVELVDRVDSGQQETGRGVEEAARGEERARG